MYPNVLFFLCIWKWIEHGLKMDNGRHPKIAKLPTWAYWHTHVTGSASCYSLSFTLRTQISKKMRKKKERERKKGKNWAGNMTLSEQGGMKCHTYCFETRYALSSTLRAHFLFVHFLFELTGSVWVSTMGPSEHDGSERARWVWGSTMGLREHDGSEGARWVWGSTLSLSEHGGSSKFRRSTIMVKKRVQNPHPKILKNLESKSVLTVNVATIFLLLYSDSLNHYLSNPIDENEVEWG